MLGAGGGCVVEEGPVQGVPLLQRAAPEQEVVHLHHIVLCRYDKGIHCVAEGGERSSWRRGERGVRESRCGFPDWEAGPKEGAETRPTPSRPVRNFPRPPHALRCATCSGANLPDASCWCAAFMNGANRSPSFRPPSTVFRPPATCSDSASRLLQCPPCFKTWPSSPQSLGQSRSVSVYFRPRLDRPACPEIRLDSNATHFFF